VKNLILAGVSFFLSSSAIADHSIQVGKPVADAAIYAISQEALVIDVRQEACDGYVKGAKLLSVDEFLNSPEFAAAKVLEWVGGDYNKDVIVYCRSGARAAKAIKVLEQYGFKKLHNLGGLGDYFDENTMVKCL
jgi:phage shock protein E